MSQYPLNGKGIDIDRNDDESNDEKEKFNIIVSKDLYILIVGENCEKDNWKTTGTGARVLGYTVGSDGKIALGMADTECYKP